MLLFLILCHNNRVGEVMILMLDPGCWMLCFVTSFLAMTILFKSQMKLLSLRA